MIEAYETDVFMDPIGMKVWEKRHQYVAAKLQSLNCKRVLDMGTNTCKLIQRLSRSLEFIQIDGMDIDGKVLQTQGIQNAKPDMIQTQYASMRNQQLVVNLYQGSALNKIQHLKNQNYDAIVLVELIEHLQVEDVPLIEQNLFGYLRPQFVIITTPNADFNVYFNFDKEFYSEMMTTNLNGRKTSFNAGPQRSAKTMVNMKKVKQLKIQELTGVGEHKTEGTKNGFCTQIVVFEKDIKLEQFTNPPQIYLQEGQIHQICQLLYPFESKEQQFQRELIESIRYILHTSDDQYEFKDGAYYNFTTLSRIMQNFTIQNNKQIQGDYSKLSAYIQSIPEFLVHENQYNFQESVVSLNYQAQMENEENDEQLDIESDNFKVQDNFYQLSNDNWFSTKDNTFSFNSTPDNQFCQKIQFSQQQMALEEIEVEDIIDY